MAPLSIERALCLGALVLAGCSRTATTPLDVSDDAEVHGNEIGPDEEVVRVDQLCYGGLVTWQSDGRDVVALGAEASSTYDAGVLVIAAQSTDDLGSTRIDLRVDGIFGVGSYPVTIAAETRANELGSSQAATYEGVDFVFTVTVFDERRLTGSFEGILRVEAEAPLLAAQGVGSPVFVQNGSFDLDNCFLAGEGVPTLGEPVPPPGLGDPVVFPVVQCLGELSFGFEGKPIVVQAPAAQLQVDASGVSVLSATIAGPGLTGSLEIRLEGVTSTGTYLARRVTLDIVELGVRRVLTTDQPNFTVTFSALDYAGLDGSRASFSGLLEEAGAGLVPIVGGSFESIACQ